jgi:hypothetical protein
VTTQRLKYMTDVLHFSHEEHEDNCNECV